MFSAIKQTPPKFSGGAVAIIVVAAIASIVFAIALLGWKRWGFYGFIVLAVVVLITNLSVGLGIGQSILGLLGMPLLHLVMNIGGPSKAWPHVK